MESKITKFFILGCILGTFLFQGYQANSSSSLSANPLIRVAILSDVNQFNLSIRGEYQIVDPITEKKIMTGRSLPKVIVKAEKSGITIDQQFYSLKQIRIVAKKDVTVVIKDKSVRYRGAIDIVLDQYNKFLVVNTIDLELYVKGVLYHEVSHRWPIEAMRAQAVAVRTYALYQAKANKNQSFDVTSNIYSQVYGGRSAERYRTNIAADRTKGEILIYKGNILPAYFHSNCGGHTEDVNELWPQGDLEPLKGVSCPYCHTAPNYYWTKNLRLKDIQDKLMEAGFKVGLIKDMAVMERNESGRIKLIKITTRDNAVLTIAGRKFREIMGPNLIKSNNYEIMMKGYYVDFAGKGWGHGVGFCQWGAYEMSRQKFKYQDILNFYYPAAEIVQLNDFFNSVGKY